VKKNRVVILGGGISGLTAAYAHLKTCEVLLLEKNTSCGGVMQSLEKGNFFFECGPRTFRTKNSPHILQLGQELGLAEEIISSSAHSTKRYVLFEKTLQPVPSWSLLALLVRAVYREWRQPYFAGDESIHAFASRRFGEAVANRLFDPLSLGVFGCDARQVSVQSAFPQLKEWEALYGSVGKGFLCTRSRKRSQPALKAPLFSFRQGTSSLIHALEKRLDGHIHLQEEALSLQKDENLIVKTARGAYPADKVISALPPHALARLLRDAAPEASLLLLSIPMISLTVVQLGYRGSILSRRGFGYLVPTSEQERVMGVVFDSEIFPSQNRGEQTRITVMLHGSYRDSAEMDAHDALRRHLSLSQTPDIVHITEAELPVMQVGHSDKIAAIQKSLSYALPELHLVGNYLGHPAVEHCIARALKT